jgi:dTDP-4-dehydrorhamnose reductase
VGARGIVHYRNRDAVSWHDFARAIVDRVQPGREVRPVATSELGRPAARPAYSVLKVERFEELLGRRVETWETGLDLCLGRLLTHGETS